MSLGWTAIAGMVVLMALLGLAIGTESAFAADLALIPRHIGHPRHGVDTSKSDTSKSDISKPDISKPDTGTRLEEFATGPNANCTAWSDGCRSCGKGPECPCLIHQEQGWLAMVANGK